MLMPSIFGENLFDEMMDSFNDEFFGKCSPLYGKNASRVMKTDIKEADGRYVIDIDLPGFKKDEIHAELKDGCLTISAWIRTKRIRKAAISAVNGTPEP